MTTSLSRSAHTLSLLDGEIVEENELGSMRRVTADNLPILNRLSIKRVVLNPGAMRTPHWHANANELTYCVSGTALVSVLDNYSEFSSFVITAGQMFHIDSGSLHHIENIGDEPAEFIIAFRNERPEDFGLGATFGAFTDAVLGNTYDLPSSDMATIRRDTSRTDHRLAARIGDPEIPSGAYFKDPHKFDIEGQPAGLTYAYGNARFARDQYWPALKDISMYSLRVAEDGMREPHWHPATAEMGYVQHGDARMTIMNPDGTLDTWNMTTGDMYFIPRAYPHHIENIGTDDWHFLIFFDQPFPADIGYRASASAYSREVLAATFNTHIDDLPNFPFTPGDPLIVRKSNPVD
ncbi:cupin domain-containing protein [Mycolicibacterium fluoranthenivorans]|uniref:Oxalate decarboxylase n=1 Tax=Mycolicibacterium fluoranthenivorans TaxID=258505 RepID=A0A7X5TYP7_9MYCO|nr:cupin domain-containing protein [Mycolicibacterium fluoranthenivorans]MCV7357378.1 cupin domain-containing protein [Mycolicibacterium fluoranthenivorans]NIH95241.1 oxalate decarboxylase [Mycolicibacterium fluoranthenivorans]